METVGLSVEYNSVIDVDGIPARLSRTRHLTSSKNDTDFELLLEFGIPTADVT
jgi:hypothetical protein